MVWLRAGVRIDIRIEALPSPLCCIAVGVPLPGRLSPELMPPPGSGPLSISVLRKLMFNAKQYFVVVIYQR